MWYFAWILGLAFACAFSVLNAMWLELDIAYRKDAHKPEENPDEDGTTGVPGRNGNA